MISREEFLKYIKVDKLNHGYCGIKLHCIDCPFSNQYNNGQTCKDNLLQYVKYVKKMDKMKEILK